MFIQNTIKNPTRSIDTYNKGAAVVLDKGELLEKAASGLCQPADSSTVRSEVIGVCNQDIAAADALTQVEYIEIFQNDLFIVDTTNNSNAAHNGQRMVLTDSKTVNNTGTDDANGIVQQEEVYGDPADKKIIVKFV